MSKSDLLIHYFWNSLHLPLTLVLAYCLGDLAGCACIAGCGLVEDGWQSLRCVMGLAFTVLAWCVMHRRRKPSGEESKGGIARLVVLLFQMLLLLSIALYGRSSG